MRSGGGQEESICPSFQQKWQTELDSEGKRESVIREKNPQKKKNQASFSNTTYAKHSVTNGDRICVCVCMREVSGCIVCNFLWGERASHTFSGRLISLQRSKQLLQSHSVITLRSRKMLKVTSMLSCLSGPGDGPENCSLCYFLQTHYSGSWCPRCSACEWKLIPTAVA